MITSFIIGENERGVKQFSTGMFDTLRYQIEVYRVMKLTDPEKLILIMLTEIHEKLKIENGIDSKFVQEAIYSDNTWTMKIMWIEWK